MQIKGATNSHVNRIWPDSVWNKRPENCLPELLSLNFLLQISFISLNKIQFLVLLMNQATCQNVNFFCSVICCHRIFTFMTFNRILEKTIGPCSIFITSIIIPFLMPQTLEGQFCLVLTDTKPAQLSEKWPKCFYFFIPILYSVPEIWEEKMSLLLIIIITLGRARTMCAMMKRRPYIKCKKSKWTDVTAVEATTELEYD